VQRLLDDSRSEQSELRVRREYVEAVVRNGARCDRIEDVLARAPCRASRPQRERPQGHVQAHPGQVTRICARFELPDERTIELPPGVSNPPYVWNCHILEHEENDMMRAFEVIWATAKLG
jgi:hypothetical protein